jgi:hypothetical protein
MRLLAGQGAEASAICIAVLHKKIPDSSRSRANWYSAIRTRLCVQTMALATSVIMGCAPSTSQISQTQAEQTWAAYFRQVRQECIEDVPGACTRFENALSEQQAYSLYYNSKTIPGLSSPVFAPVTVPAAMGMPHFSGSMGGFR